MELNRIELKCQILLYLHLYFKPEHIIQIMKNNVRFFWISIMVMAMSACQDSNAGQGGKISEESLLDNGVAEQVQAIIEEGGEVYGKTASFEYVNFESGAAAIQKDDPAYREIEELAMVMNAYPRMNLEIIAYADQGGSMGSPKSLAKMRSLSIKSALIDNGVNNQMISTKGVAASEGDNSLTGNRVEVRLLGE